VISLPGGVFKPYAGVSTAVLLLTKTNSGGTDHVWFYDLQADGWSLDDKRQPLLDAEALGCRPARKLSEAEHTKNNLPDVLQRWRTLHPLPVAEATGAAEPAARFSAELSRPRTAQSFCVPRADIEANGYDLSLNRYKEVVHEVVAHRAPADILAELERLETEIQRGMRELAGMVG
jgi:type I restriction enzyme M protein